MLIDVTCWNCGSQHTICVQKENYDKWVNEEELIQDALWDKTADERELLMSGTCGDCWDKLFPPCPEEIE